MTRKEHRQIIFTSIVLTILVSIAYAYFIGADIEIASHGMAQFLCTILHISCP